MSQKTRIDAKKIAGAEPRIPVRLRFELEFSREGGYGPLRSTLADPS